MDRWTCPVRDGDIKDKLNSTWSSLNVQQNKTKQDYCIQETVLEFGL